MNSKDNIQTFDKELDFEVALCEVLKQHGWEAEIFNHPTEEELLENWAQIIYENNREQEKLGNAPLTPTEMQQIIDQVNSWHTPYEINSRINARLVSIKRDNEKDTHNYGKEVYLKLFDAKEICAGQSRYQIVRQPHFKTAHPLAGDRRGDVMLLINGMPLIHVELKRSHDFVSNAVGQIKRYMHEGVFSQGIFSLVQVFVAMTPEKTLYFANPGKEDGFSEEFQFHWADYNNDEIFDWHRVATELLNIPMAHQLIGYYTIADDKDQTLKVLRSYQYQAVIAIWDVTQKTNWDEKGKKGGYIWHTTGSGKTMTSFKTAQLIANSGDADKVVFLVDRIELSIQSLDEYRGFAGEDDTIQDTQNTLILANKLESTDSDDKLIVTSIQKMSNIKDNPLVSDATIEKIGKKRLVFIVDECHRSVFGKMLLNIQHTFPKALLFGFTGTPVFDENSHNDIKTETLFGSMLLDVHSLEEIQGNEEMMRVYNRFMNELQMPSDYMENGVKKHGIEYYLPRGRRDIYQQPEHHQKVAQHISRKFAVLSKNYKFHAMLATQNIPEAMAYYKIFKEQYSYLNVVAVFDNNIDNTDEGIAKEDALLEMMSDYNAKYKTNFALPNYGKYKKDVAKRLAHKKPYTNIEHDRSQQIDLLIVVTQMLTGYDSKWVNTLYVDKLMAYVDIIQGFSRTNRIFNKIDKPWGNIYYYSFPYTMEKNIEAALELYVDRPLGVFVDKLEQNLNFINDLFLHIRDIFQANNILNFEKLPPSPVDCRMFAQDFVQMTRLIEAAKFQGFEWEQSEYFFKHDNSVTTVKMELDEQTYQILFIRYKELFDNPPGPRNPGRDFDYPENVFITEISTGKIDAEYINSKFEKFIKQLYSEGPGSEMTKAALKELHKTFASLTQKDQRTAILILHDIQRGDLRPEPGKTLQDYINEYELKELFDQMRILHEATGVDFDKLKTIMTSNVTEDNLNDFERFTELRKSIDKEKTITFIEMVEGKPVAPPFMMTKWSYLLKEFILSADSRKKILYAYLHDDVTIENVEEESEDNIDDQFENLENPQTPSGGVEPHINEIKARIEEIIAFTLKGVSQNMRPQKEIIDALMYVIDKESLETLDGVGVFINRAFVNLFKQNATIVDKHVAFNLLVTKFEAYLKKLYYLYKGEEVKPQQEGKDVTWANVIYAVKPLWQLKFNQNDVHQRLYQYLQMVKEWRNAESHISPTASEQEINGAINIILTMYCYATGMCITDLEMAGHDIPNEDEMPLNRAAEGPVETDK